MEVQDKTKTNPRTQVIEPTRFRHKTDGERVSFARKAKGFTQKQLSDKTGISQQEISEIEKAEHIDDETIIKIANALDIDPQFLRNWETDGFTNIFNIESMGEGEGSTIMAGGYNFETNHQITIHPVDKICELYDRMLKEKQDIIIQKDKVINELKEEILQIKEQIKNLQK